MQVAILAAGFTPGEADQLRRAMAAWKRKGGLEKYYERIVGGMLERGYTLEFAEAIFSQIQGFGEYGFPESHAASFALLAYASAWMKRHEPGAFLCALLNSQPMGFYSPSQLVQDARRHGIEVRPVDIAISGWDSALEEVDDTRARQPAVRLGLSLQRGMRREVAARIEDARAIRPFDSVADLARRAGLDRGDLQVLAASNALASLAGNRRQALWQAVGAVPDKDLLRPTTPDEETPQLRAPSEGDEIVGDYRSQGLTLGRHPLALLRPQLLKQRFMPAATLNDYQNGQLARACGIVTVRQRPGTAKGVLFMTLEDETGNINVIIWPKPGRAAAPRSAARAAAGRVRDLAAGRGGAPPGGQAAGGHVGAAGAARHPEPRFLLAVPTKQSTSSAHAGPHFTIADRTLASTCARTTCAG